MKTEEILIEECLKIFEKAACKETYQMKKGVIASVKHYYQSRINTISYERKSLDILTLVNSNEFKNLEYIYQQHNMIKEKLLE